MGLLASAPFTIRTVPIAQQAGRLNIQSQNWQKKIFDFLNHALKYGICTKGVFRGLAHDEQCDANGNFKSC